MERLILLNMKRDSDQIHDADSRVDMVAKVLASFFWFTFVVVALALVLVAFAWFCDALISAWQ